jgi:hypothetical protein
MTPFLFWVAAGCAACALAGFSLVRVVARVLPVGIAEPSPAPTAASAGVSGARPVPGEEPPGRPVPSGPQPESEKLELWARQIKAGERKMSVATDGCRVTWNRTCKHGHSTWLVYLGYL